MLHLWKIYFDWPGDWRVIRTTTLIVENKLGTSAKNYFRVPGNDPDCLKENDMDQ